MMEQAVHCCKHVRGDISRIVAADGQKRHMTIRNLSSGLILACPSRLFVRLDFVAISPRGRLASGHA